MVVECNKEQENVPILHHQMAAKTATCLDQHLSQETAVLTLAQVRVCLILYLGQILIRLVKMFHRRLCHLALLNKIEVCLAKISKLMKSGKHHMDSSLHSQLMVWI